MPLPSFGRDTAVVSGYLAAGYEAYLRLFMPLDSAEGPVRWSALLAGGEAALRGDLRFFDDIDPAVRERRGLELTCGKSDAGWRARLAGVLSEHTSTPDDMRYALWPGYAGELDAMAGRLTPLPSAPGEARSGEVLPGNSGAFPRGTFPAELGCLLYPGSSGGRRRRRRPCGLPAVRTLAARRLLRARPVDLRRFGLRLGLAEARRCAGRRRLRRRPGRRPRLAPQLHGRRSLNSPDGDVF